MSGLIDRDTAVRIMMEFAEDENSRRYEHLDNKLAFHRYLHGECCYKKAADRLKKLPDAEEKPKMAYLKKAEVGNMYLCSVCGCAYPEYTKSPYVILNYCTKCGAKMVRGYEAGNELSGKREKGD